MRTWRKNLATGVEVKPTMNAIEYLIDRTWPPAWKASALLTLGTLLSWVNVKGANIISTHFPTLIAGELSSRILVGLAFVATMIAVGTVLGIVLLVPLFLTYRCTNLIHAWTRQRVVEEMVCAGMPGSTILDRSALFALRWWAVAVGPSLVLGCFLFSEMARMVSPTVLLGYLLSVASLSYLGAFATAWTGYCGGKVKTPLLGALLVVQGVPALALMVFGISGASLMWASIYVIVTARWAAIYALENSESLRSMDNKVRRVLRVGSGTHNKSLSENPILARESMRGTDSADLIARALTAASFGLATIGVICLESPGIFVVLLIAAVAFNCYRAAGKMSQIVTEEIETSTLETIRSTPMGSEQFLNGWLRAVLRPMFMETSVLLGSVGLATIAFGHGSDLFQASTMMGVALCFALPLSGAYIGASIAGQGQSRSQISGQLILSFGAFVIAAVPQAMVSTAIFSLPASLGGLALLTGGLCWLLGTGAKKSLNRVFLPQK